MPWRWKPHMASPVRPKPGWTSSAMYRPPASCTASSTGFRTPAGSGWIPSEENRLSAMKAASLTPCRLASAIEFRTRSARSWYCFPRRGRRDRPHGPAQRDRRAEAGRDLGGGRGYAVVGVGRDDRPLAAGPEARDAQGEVDRLAAGAGEHDVAEFGRVRAEQPLGVVEDELARVPGVRVEGGRLAGDRLGHPRVAVPDRRHVVVGVQVGLPVGVEQVHALGADDPHRVPVEQLVRRAEQARPPLDDPAELGIEGVDGRHVEAVDHGRGVTHGSPPGGCAR